MRVTVLAVKDTAMNVINKIPVEISVRSKKAINKKRNKQCQLVIRAMGKNQSRTMRK